jgi:CHC2 zinc finger/Toprim domain
MENKNEVVKIGDGFDGYEDGTEGEQERGGGVIKGAIIKFTNEAAWLLPDEDEIDPKREFIAVDIIRVIQRWHDAKPAETIVIGPHEKFPDVRKMNDEVPKEEWIEGPDGQPRGPWQAQHLFYLLDPVTMDRFTFPTGTVGGSMAARDFDDGDVKIWIPGEPVPPEFLEAARNPDWLLIAHADQFERAVETRLLHPRFGWPLIPIERRRCTMAASLASALPGALDNVTAALGLPGKDAEGTRIMRLMCRPRRARKGEDPAILHWRDSPEMRAKLCLYCQRDVEIERALYHRLPPLSAAEQELWALDGRINARGYYVDIALAAAADKIVAAARGAITADIRDITGGEIGSINQVAKIQAFVRARGHKLAGVTKRSVSAVLAHGPGDVVRRVLELRQEGGRTSTNKLSSLFAGVDDDNRLRGTLVFHAASTGRWAGRRFQPQNLKRAETKDIDGAIAAVLTGELAEVRKLGPPLTIVGDVQRGVICAAPGHRLIAGDFSAIESRVLAWLAGEKWKLETYRKYDETGDPKFEPYCVMASQALRREVTPDDEVGRQLGKTYDLAFGFGGGLGAWRKFDSSDAYSDADIERFKNQFRRSHATTVRFWHALERAAHRCINTGKTIVLNDRICFDVEDGTLFMQLPSGRRLAYPEARTVPGKYEGTRNIRHKNNANGAWSDVDSWCGTMVENTVQAVARDLLAAAMLRLERAGYPVVLHVHDEIVCEVPDGAGSEDEFAHIMLAPPAWAAGLPIAGKIRSGKRYSKPGRAPPRAAAQIEAAQSELGISQAPEVPAEASQRTSKPATGLAVEHNRVGDEDDAGGVDLADLLGRPLVDGKVCCPFHDDRTPSCHIYDDHFHCFGCGARGDAIDWLMMIEGMDRKQAIEALESWDRPKVKPRKVAKVDYTPNALRLWEKAKPIAGTLAEKYLVEVRGIDIAVLPVDVDEVLRFHRCCPFNGHTYPCLLALMRNATTDEPTGIHRIALTPDAQKINRMMLGRAGAVKIWPATDKLVVGEGIETVLAAATRITHRGAPLRPAWSLLSGTGMMKLPIITGVETLTILVDNDKNGVGQRDANACAERWCRAGRRVVKLTPKRPDTDFNDLVIGGR